MKTIFITVPVAPDTEKVEIYYEIEYQPELDRLTNLGYIKLQSEEYKIPYHYLKLILVDIRNERLKSVLIENQILIKEKHYPFC